MNKTVVFLLTAFIILNGCQRDPYADKYTTTEPKFHEVVGTYGFDYQNVDWDFDKEEIKKNSPTIILNAYSTFEIRQIPFFREIKKAKYNYDNGISTKGTWTIQTIGSIDFGQGGIKRHWGVILESLPDELRYAGLMGQEKPDGIIFGFGDPDEGRVMTFIKR